MNERKGIITMGGNPMTLVGNEPKIGEKAPDFTLLDAKLEPKSLKDFAGKIKVISVAPSLDTKVCNLQLHWFNEDMASRPEGVVVLNVTMDLPFAIGRFCATEGIENAIALSDHREASFGLNYGVLIKELRLLARSIFIVDKDDILRYVQIVPEETNEPNYDDAVKFLETL
ncbi:MAG: thiol peroxidase [Synergistaceae bacterium]|nr:thiol peroxidase [Synergistaceae bacterium]MBQ4418090.1 thiol peroxidase [Synergistaceae bacterium]